MTSKLTVTAAVAAIAGVLLAAPATRAAVLYSNGAINLTIGGWYINSGRLVTDSFALSSAATVSGIDFGEFTNDGVEITVGWSITTRGFSGTTLGSGTANVSSTFVNSPARGYSIYETSFSIPDLSLAAGTYWLELGDTSGGFWIENDGASSALAALQSHTAGAIAIRSESFDITGTAGQAVPEPASLLLLGSGLAGLASIRRRKRA